MTPEKSKLNEWTGFSMEVGNHIITYCLPQYGDYPDEMLENMTLSDIKTHLESYCKRIGSSVRGEQDAIRDSYKIAHYACLLRSKLAEGSI